MLAMFFVHDGGSTRDWRIKGHAAGEFWRWVGSWSAMIRRPSDLGYDDDGFALPPLTINHRIVESDFKHDALIPGVLPLDLNERRRARRGSLTQRVAMAAELSGDDEAQVLYWCDLNAESSAIASTVSAVEVRGSDSIEHKRDALVGFAEGDIRRLVTKPRIGGWGMNWQRCHRMIFVGLSDSYESFYQSTRRCWRFGQTEPVDVDLVYSEHERAVIANVLGKEARHREMQDAMIGSMVA